MRRVSVSARSRSARAVFLKSEPPRVSRDAVPRLLVEWGTGTPLHVGGTFVGTSHGAFSDSLVNRET